MLLYQDLLVDNGFYKVHMWQTFGGFPHKSVTWKSLY